MSISDRYDYDNNRGMISQDELAVIRRRPNIMILGYLNGDEGASMAQCYYAMFYTLYGAVNMRRDIVSMLKRVRLSFVCAVNADRLQSMWAAYKANEHGTLTVYAKNMRDDGSCTGDGKGVNLKYNFMADVLDNACSVRYRGPEAKSEPEIKAIFKYLSLIDSNVKSVVIMNK
jgi:Zinc carboxypeptidase